VAAAVPAPPHVELVVEVEEDLGATGDPTLLRQVMIGLLTNAFKNTPPPGPLRYAAATTARRRSSWRSSTLEPEFPRRR